MSHPFLFNERFTDYDEKKKNVRMTVVFCQCIFVSSFWSSVARKMSLIEMPNALFTRRKKVVYFQRVYKV